jgi:hypothetical protein
LQLACFFSIPRALRLFPLMHNCTILIVVINIKASFFNQPNEYGSSYNAVDENGWMANNILRKSLIDNIKQRQSSSNGNHNQNVCI